MSKLCKKISPYICLVLLAILILELFLKIFHVSWSVPIRLKNDYLLIYMFVKGLLGSEWTIFSVPHISLLGAPDVNSMGDFPIFDWNLMFVIMKMISIFTQDYLIVTHAYYFLTYILCAITCFYVLNRYRIKPLISISASLLFAFAPFHILRSVEHLTYSSCFLIPLQMMTILWIWSKKPLFFKYSENKWQLDFLNKKSLLAVAILFLTAISNLYFNYFFMFFAVAAGISAYFYRKNIYNAFSSEIMIIVNLFFTVLNALPFIVYKIQNGTNLEAAQRAFFEAEFYGLKIIQLILPVDNHFLFSDWKEIYNAAGFIINENGTATLGFCGVVGFMFLLFYFLFVNRKDFNIYKKLGFLTVSSLLLAAVGSFSSFISFVFLREIRCYNRISIFILFMAIFAFALLLQKLYKKINNKILSTFIIILITIIGLRDQIPRGVSLTHTIPKNEVYWEMTADFIKNIESVNKDKAMIFQLPYVAFPEAPAIHKLGHYEQAKPYLLSDKLHWSYATMKGREIDEWYSFTASMHVADMVKEIKNKNFSGILINKKGYDKKQLKDLTNEFNKILGAPKYVNKEYLYYHL